MTRNVTFFDDKYWSPFKVAQPYFTLLSSYKGESHVEWSRDIDIVDINRDMAWVFFRWSLPGVESYLWD
jgi:hypothetical protein